MIHELRCWANSKQDGRQGEVCVSEPVVREQGENSGVPSKWRGCGSGWGGQRGGVDGSLTVTALRCSHGKSLPGIVFKVYLYSFMPILIFLNVIYTEGLNK